MWVWRLIRKTEWEKLLENFLLNGWSRRDDRWFSRVELKEIVLIRETIDSRTFELDKNWFGNRRKIFFKAMLRNMFEFFSIILRFFHCDTYPFCNMKNSFKSANSDVNSINVEFEGKISSDSFNDSSESYKIYLIHETLNSSISCAMNETISLIFLNLTKNLKKSSVLQCFQIITTIMWRCLQSKTHWKYWNHHRRWSYILQLKPRNAWWSGLRSSRILI